MLEPADGGERADGSARRRRRVSRGGARPRRRRPCAPASRRRRRCRARDVGGIGTGEGRDQGRGRRRVGDPHVTGEQHVGTLVDEVVRDLDTASSAQRIVRGSSPARRSRSAVPWRTRGAQARARRRAVVGDADVDHAPRRTPAWRCERVDGGAPREEVRDHLRGDLLRPRGHALGVDAMVAGEHGDGGGCRVRAEGTSPAMPARRTDDVLEGAQRAPRLGQAVLAGARIGDGDRLAGRRVARARVTDGGIEEGTRRT